MFLFEFPLVFAYISMVFVNKKNYRLLLTEIKFVDVKQDNNNCSKKIKTMNKFISNTTKWT